jgi:hypothetical protein
VSISGISGMLVDGIRGMLVGGISGMCVSGVSCQYTPSFKSSEVQITYN